MPRHVLEHSRQEAAWSACNQISITRDSAHPVTTVPVTFADQICGATERVGALMERFGQGTAVINTTGCDLVVGKSRGAVPTSV